MKIRGSYRIIILFFIMIILCGENKQQDSLDHNNLFSDLTNPSDANIYANSRPLIISQKAEIQEQFLSPILPSNVSYILQNGWSVQNTTILYDGVSQRKNYATNGGMNTSQSGWTFRTNTGSDITNSWQSGGNTRFYLSTNTMTTNGFAFLEQSVTLTEPFTPDKVLSFSVDYYFDPRSGMQDLAELSLAVKIGSIQESYNVSVTELYQKSWKKITFSYIPSEVGQTVPGSVNFHFGVWTPTSYQDDYSNYLYFDNIELKCSTLVNQANLIIAKDLDSNMNSSYKNTSQGSGYSFISTQKLATSTKTMYFTISKNTTATTADIEILNITIQVALECQYNSTYMNEIGCYYSIEGNQSKWTTDITLANPSTYVLKSVEIEKPVDWQITHIWDSYRTDQISSCIGTELGESKLIIPMSVYIAGIWALDAISFNYLERCDLLWWNGASYENRSTFLMNDRMQVEVFLNNSLSLSNTKLNITIKYPNASIFYQESRAASSINSFGDFYIGLNMTTGVYQILLEWVNNGSISNLDKVGFLYRSFTIIHNTILAPLETNYVKYGNEPFLLKLNYTDIDTNHPIELATLTYNCSSGNSGDMMYIGSGIYAVDVNTGSMGLGSFAFSFNASKSFYINQTLLNAVNLVIVPDRLALQVPRVVQTVFANSYFYCQFNVTGALFGDFLTPVNISTDWALDYSIKDWNNGTYGLNLSTFEMTTTGVPETFTINIFANKTDYGYDTNSISITITPVASDIMLNQSMFEAYLLQNFSLFVNYTNANTNEIISNPVCNIYWDSDYQITPYLNGFVCEFSTHGLSSDYFTGYIEFSHKGFQTVKKPFFIFIKPLNASVDLNQSLFQIYLMDNFSISLNYTNVETQELIPDANCYVSWGANYQVTNINAGYQIELSSLNLAPDYYVGYVELSRSGYETIRKSFYVFIKPLKTNINLNQSLFDIYLLDNFSIFVNYTNLDTGELIPDANCAVSWGSNFQVTNMNDGYQIELSTLNLGTDYYIGYVEFSRNGYETIRSPFNVVIKPIKTTIMVQNSGTMRFIKGDIANISCRVLAKNEILDSANLTFIGINLNSLFLWDGSYYNFAFDTSNLTIKSYLVQILASGENLETNIYDLVFEIVPLLLKIEIAESFITIQSNGGSSVDSVKFQILDESHGLYRTDLSITYSIRGENFTSITIMDGFYVIYLEALELNPSNEPYQLSLLIFNPNGNNATALISLFVPIPTQTFNPFLTYVLLGISGILILAFVGYIYKKNYTDLTKFQRDIRDFKKQLLNKQPIKVLPESSRNMLILMCIKKSLSNN